MKTTIVIIFILISSLFFSCNNNKCPQVSAIYIQPPVLYFSIVDSEGNDLFFGENSIYDPHSVKITVGQGDQQLGGINVNELNKCFSLGTIGGETFVFYVEFIPNRIDTIKTESPFAGWFEYPEGCRHHMIYKYNLYFNNVPICLVCDNNYEIYKIEIK